MNGPICAIALLSIIVSGCDMQEMKIESANKSEYSVLQYYEYEYREVNHDKSYMVFKRALKSEFTVVAFPIKDKPKGYVAILANTVGIPKVKATSEADFVVTKEAYAAVKAEASLSKEVDQFIAARIR